MYKELKEKFKAENAISVCLEKETRLHVHVFIEVLSETLLNCDLAYFETTKSGPPGDCKVNRGRNVDRGHWYVQCEWKKSHITSFFDRKVKPKQNWLMDEWRNEKIEEIKEALAAEKLLTPQLLLQISAVNNHNENRRIEKMLEERDMLLKADRKRFEMPERVEQWMGQYLQTIDRYKFIVLCGPSKMRKTVFAKSLFSNPFVHKDKVDWDGYKWLEHNAIIFDDVSQPDHIWKYVRLNKILFQASSKVAVNTSATNCYKRDVCVVQRPIIICTNDGLLDPFVSGPYREWIEQNCVWLDITEPIPFLGETVLALEDEGSEAAG
jgi:hypothetical protein